MLGSAIIRIVYLGLMFIAGLILSNITLPENFGTISLIVLNASLLSVVTSMGADSMVLYKVANGEWGQAKATKFTWMAIAVQILIFSTLEFVSLFFWQSTLLSKEGSDFLILDATYFVGLLLTEKFLALLYAFHRSRIANILLACSAAFYVVVLFIAYNLKHVNVQSVLRVFAGQSFLQGFLLSVFFYGKQKPKERELLHLKEFATLLRVSSIVMVTNVIQLLAYRVDYWLIQLFWGKYEVGLFAQANKFANLCWLVPNIFAQLLLPKFAGLEKKQIQEVFSTAFYTNIVLLLLTIICSYLFYSFYLHSSYREGLMSFYLMLPGYFLWASVIYFGAFVSSTGKFTYNLVCSSACLVIILGTDMALIPSFGIEGAAIANTISYAAVFLIYLYIFSKKYSFRPNHFFLPGKNILINVFKIIAK